MSRRQSESEKVVRILEKILASNPPVPGLAPRDRKWALELAVSLFKCRAIDATDD